MSFDLFKLFYQHAKAKGIHRIEFVIGALRYGPHISEKLIKAGYSALWKTMDNEDFEKYDDYSVKEIFKHLTPEYKRFIKRRQNTTMKDIELLKVQYDGALSPVLFRSKSEQAEIVQVVVPMRLAAE